MKKKRQETILSLIRERNIETQEELCALLAEAGFEVTQATVSRDIRELKITKTPLDNGGQKYSLQIRERNDSDERSVTILRQGVISCDTAGNILVIRTESGMAMAVAAALDSMAFPEIVGTIAGDDTIMCAIKTEREAQMLLNRIMEMC